MAYRSLVFDFDGTLASTLDASVDVYNTLAQKHGLRPILAGELPALRNMSLTHFLHHQGIAKRLVPRLLYSGTRLLREKIAEIPLVDGFREVLCALRPKSEHFGILTSNTTENVHLFLEKNGLEDIFTFVSSTSRLKGKAKYLRAIRRTFSINLSEMIYIGDEVRDVKAAQKAGVEVAAVTWGFNSKKALEGCLPDYIFSSPHEMLVLA